MMKVCFKCNTERELSEFYKHPGMTDGHLGKCKECTRRDTQLNRLNKIDYYTAYEKVRSKSPQRREKLVEYRKRRPKYKKHANTAVGIALRSGRLVRQPCEVCGNPKSEAHHDDYTKPLHVRWLCFKHHREVHGQVVREGATH